MSANGNSSKQNNNNNNKEEGLMSSLTKSLSNMFSANKGEAAASAPSAATATPAAAASAAPSAMNKNLSALFNKTKAASTKLLQVPANVVSAASNTASNVASSATNMVTNATSNVVNAASAVTAAAVHGPSFISYLIMLLLLAFLFFNIYVILVKPVNKGILEYYEELIAEFSWAKMEEKIKKLFIQPAQAAPASAASAAQAAQASAAQAQEEEENPLSTTKKNTTVNSQNALKTLENTIDNKRIVNNIDNKNKTTDIIEKKKKFDYTPDENDSRVQQSKAKSGTGFCYIGEDRGFRSCIDVKEGDVCMSGDIFPSRDICINPRLRE